MISSGRASFSGTLELKRGGPNCMKLDPDRVGMSDAHPLLAHLHDAARGVFPAVDGQVTILPQFHKRMRAVVCFTGHAFIAADVDLDSTIRMGADGFGGALAPDFLTWLAGASGRILEIDAILVAFGRGLTSTLPRRFDLDQHPRVELARSLRSDVTVFGDDRGLVTVSRGIARRLEMSIELPDANCGLGTGRKLIAEALNGLPREEPVFAAVSPGNARSLRAFLSAGFKPIGSEVIIIPGTGQISAVQKGSP